MSTHTHPIAPLDALVDGEAQRFEVHDRLDGRHGGLEVLELFSKVYRHSSQDYATRGA